MRGGRRLQFRVEGQIAGVNNAVPISVVKNPVPKYDGHCCQVIFFYIKAHCGFAQYILPDVAVYRFETVNLLLVLLLAPSEIAVLHIESGTAPNRSNTNSGFFSPKL